MPTVALSIDDAKRNEAAFFEQQVDDLWNRWQSRTSAIAASPRRYLILSTPRTGSTMLSRYLNGTNRAGYVHEWMNWEFMMHSARRCQTGSISIGDYVNMIDRATSTANGIVGMNVHVHQHRFLLSKGFDVFKIGFDRVYWLERRDRVAQAYSWAKAFKSKCWSKDMERALGFPDGLNVDVSAHETARFLASICDDTEFFRKHISPKQQIHREFTYESIAPDGCSRAVNDILVDLGLEPEPPGGRSGTNDPGKPMTTQSGDIDRERIAAIKHFFGLVTNHTEAQGSPVP